jgi:hypothetical protein
MKSLSKFHICLYQSSKTPYIAQMKLYQFSKEMADAKHSELDINYRSYKICKYLVKYFLK